ncbi:MAG: zf-HC2 domain-containing protein [Candidatus Omnitrophica bacterium]|nr:zf-HC2 domain-containing protein [Candidatus Omnitrophota bacterium]
MTCAEYKRWLSPYVDEALEPAERAQLDEHLGRCVRCRAELDGLARMVQALRRLDAPAAPDLLPAVRARLAGSSPAWRAAFARFLAPWPSSLPLHGAALATAALLVVMVARVPLKRAVEDRGRQRADQLGEPWSSGEATDSVEAERKGALAQGQRTPAAQSLARQYEPYYATQNLETNRSAGSTNRDGLDKFGKFGTIASITRAGTQKEAATLDIEHGGISTTDTRQRVGMAAGGSLKSPSSVMRQREEPQRSAWELQARGGGMKADGSGPSADDDAWRANGIASSRSQARSSDEASKAKDALAPADRKLSTEESTESEEWDKRLVQSQLLSPSARGIASPVPVEGRGSVSGSFGSVAAGEAGSAASGSRTLPSVAEKKEAPQSPEAISPRSLSEVSGAARLDSANGVIAGTVINAGPPNQNQSAANLSGLLRTDQPPSGAVPALETISQSPQLGVRGSGFGAKPSDTNEAPSLGAEPPALSPEPRKVLEDALEPSAHSLPTLPPASAAVGVARLIQLRWHVERPQESLAEIRDWVRAHEGLATATTEGHLSIRLPELLVSSFLTAFSPEASRDDHSAVTAERASTPAEPAKETETSQAGGPVSSSSLWVTISLDLVAAE